MIARTPALPRQRPTARSVMRSSPGKPARGTEKQMQELRQFAQTLIAGRRLLASALLALFALGIFAHVLLGNNGWVSYRLKQAEYRKLQDEIQRVDEENRSLEAQIKALKSDPKAIEREAREKLHYAKPGEVIYLMPEQAGQDSNQPTQQAEVQRR